MHTNPTSWWKQATTTHHRSVELAISMVLGGRIPIPFRPHCCDRSGGGALPFGYGLSESRLLASDLFGCSHGCSSCGCICFRCHSRSSVHIGSERKSEMGQYAHQFECCGLFARLRHFLCQRESQCGLGWKTIRSDVSTRFSGI